MSVAKGKPITIRFDTHYSLNKAKEWHPSVVANVSAMKDVAVDRVLLRVGHGDGFTTFIDALSGYEFGAFCEEREPNQAYAQSAAERLGPMKLPISILQEFQRKLADPFSGTGRRAVRGGGRATPDPASCQEPPGRPTDSLDQPAPRRSPGAWHRGCQGPSAA